MTDTEVVRKDNRYELWVGGKVAGLAAFADRGEQRVFTHTEITGRTWTSTTASPTRWTR